MAREGIRDKVSIVGCRLLPVRRELGPGSPADMIVDAAYEAYADAGIDDTAEADRRRLHRQPLHHRRGRTSAPTHSSSSTSR